MCDVATTNVINEILDDWVDSGKMFTAYEVSREVRNRWNDDDGRCPRHGEIKNDIHNMMSAHVDYRRVSMDVGAPDQAWVYYRNGDDPLNYKPFDRANLDQSDPGRVTPPPTPVVSADPSYTVAVDLGDDADDTDDTDDTAAQQPVVVKISGDASPNLVNVGSENRLLLRASDMRQVGFTPLDTAYVIPDQANQCVIVTPDSPKNTFDFSCKTVTSDNEIRLHQDIFKKAGIPGQQYRVIVDAQNRRIEIKAA